MTREEELLLNIVSNNEFEEYNNCIGQLKNKFVVEQLSHIRGNLIEWLPISDKRILELNGCYGAVSECIVQKAKTLDVLVFEDNQYDVCSRRMARYNNASVIRGDLSDVIKTGNQYDFVIIANPFFESVEQLTGVVNECTKILQTNGKVCVSVDNKYGLKYFDGAQEPNKGVRFFGVEGYRDYCGVRCFSKQEIVEAIDNTNIAKASWYYPYPDRLLPLSIYSDEYLPKKGELVNNIRNFGEPNVISFDENQVWDNLISDGLFQQFSNAYLLLLEV